VREERSDAPAYLTRHELRGTEGRGEEEAGEGGGVQEESEGIQGKIEGVLALLSVYCPQRFIR